MQWHSCLTLIVVGARCYTDFLLWGQSRCMFVPFDLKMMRVIVGCLHLPLYENLVVFLVVLVLVAIPSAVLVARCLHCVSS